MNSIGILTGEDADLPKSIIKNSPVHLFPFIVERLKTSQPSVKTFAELFAKLLKSYQEIIVITISAHFSGTYHSAGQAKKLLSQKDQTRIHIIDSMSSTGAEALLTLKTVELISKNKKIDFILKSLAEIIPNTHLLGVFDNPDSLQAGGRINAVQAVIVKNMLKIGLRSILTIKDGQIITKKVQTNAKNKAAALFKQFKEEIISSTKKISVVITHSDCETEAKTLKKMIVDYNQSTDIKFVNTISPVINTHLGKGTLILSWMTE